MHRLVCLAVWLGFAVSPVLAAEPIYKLETVAAGLNHPWASQFLPNGDILITEKLGGLRIVRAGKLDPAPIKGLPTAYQESDCGVLDLALDPDFATNKRVFIALSMGDTGANHMAVFRARFDGKALTHGRVIFRSAPNKTKGNHCGARIVFLADKTFVMTIGDGLERSADAQNLRSDLGKTVRLTRDGLVPSSNPFVRRTNARSEIYSYGHRNAQGIVRDPRNGQIWLHEHGPRGGDEINLLKAGANYGWPDATSDAVESGAAAPKAKGVAAFEQPAVVWAPSIAPSGFALYLGDKFPAWQGDFFVGALAEKSLRRVRISNGKATTQEVLLRELDARIRDVREGPDGFLYVLTDEENGRLLRLTPAACAVTCERR